MTPVACTLSAIESYALAWRLRASVIPVFVGMRVLGVAAIAPMTGLAAVAAVSLSGQPALTDEDILRFLLTPVGFAAGLGAAAVLFVGAVLGVAVMTVQLRRPEARGLSELPAALGRVLARLPALLAVAVLLMLRGLLILAPFALAAGAGATVLLGAHDINYYLAARPAEFLAAAVLGAVLATGAALTVLHRASGWALALHLVLFGETTPRAAFAASAERMEGRRVRLLRDLLAWLGLRVGLSLVAAGVFGLLLRLVPGLFDVHVRTALALVLLLVLGWLLVETVISAVSLGALALLLNARSEAPAPRVSPVERQGRWPRSPRVALAGAAAAVTLGYAAGGTMLTMASEPEDAVAVIGHRGAAGARPENTLAAISRAVEDGADWVEIDVQATADGEVVVIHDRDLMKLAGVELRVRDATLAELAQIDIGSWFDPSYADERTPTLAQALEAVRGRARLLIELKYYGADPDLGPRVAEVVERAGMEAEVAVMSLSYSAVRAMRGFRPDWRVGVLAATTVGRLARLEGDFVAVNAATVTPRLVRATRVADKDLYAWTVNDPLRMSALVSMGVDGLITDEPRLARETLEVRAALGAPGRLLLFLAERLGIDLPVKVYRDASA